METHVPPEWENHDETDLVDASYYDLFSCNRVGLGSTERPVALLLETHGAFSRPDSCSMEGFNTLAVLQQVYVNDTLLASELANRGVPVTVADLEGEILPTAAGQVDFVWTWTVMDGPVSHIQSHSYYPTTIKDISQNVRYVWFANGAIGYIDLDMTLVSYYYNTAAQYGEVHAPMLYADTGLPVYIATSDVADGTSFSGTFGGFGDVLCQTPS